MVGTAAAVWIGGSAGPAYAGTHLVRPGETLSAIAARYGTTVTRVARMNRLGDPDVIVAGSRLRVPGGGRSAPRRITHRVRAGQTLSSIAARYGTTVRRLARANRIANVNRITVGQRLKVRGGSASAPRPATRRATGRATRGHVVASGETLSSVAARYGTSVRRLARMNRLADPNLIVAGTRLRVPAGRSARAAPRFVPRATVGAALHRHAVAHGVNPALVKAMAWVESGWRQDVVSSAGAIGVMQVMPGTARFINRELGGGRLRVRRGDDNVHLGVMYLRHLLGTMPSEAKALAAYYSGPGNVGRRLRPYQRVYVRAVRSFKPRFR